MTEESLLARIEQQAAEIANLKSTVERLAKQLEDYPKMAVDGFIERMRNTAVNCGKSSTCAVAGWARKSYEK